MALRAEAGFGGEARGASSAVGESVTDAAQANGLAKPAVLAVPEGFLTRALELFESGGGEGKVTAAEAGGVGLKALGEFVDPSVADAEKPGNADGGPFGRGRLPPLPDELLDDTGFEAAAPGKRRTPARGTSFLNVDQARLASARRFVARSLGAHGAIIWSEFRPRPESSREAELYHINLIGDVAHRKQGCSNAGIRWCWLDLISAQTAKPWEPQMNTDKHR